MCSAFLGTSPLSQEQTWFVFSRIPLKLGLAPELFYTELILHISIVFYKTVLTILNECSSGDVFSLNFCLKE